MTTVLLMRRLLTGLLAVALLTSACGDDDDPDDRAAVTSIPDETTTSSTTTEPATVAPDVIPTDERQITEQYVEQVLNELFKSSNEALLLTMEAGVVDEAAIELVEAVTSSSHGRSTLNGLAELAQSDFQGIVGQPTGLRAEVISVIEVGKTCVAAEITMDTSGVTGAQDQGSPDARGFAELVPASPDQLASGHNPTAWVIAALPATTDGSTPSFLCRA